MMCGVWNLESAPLSDINHANDCMQDSIDIAYPPPPDAAKTTSGKASISATAAENHAAAVPRQGIDSSLGVRPMVASSSAVRAPWTSWSNCTNAMGDAYFGDDDATWNYQSTSRSTTPTRSRTAV